MGRKSRSKRLNLTREEEIDLILRPVSDEQMEGLSKKELIILLRGEQQLRKICEEINAELTALKRELQDKNAYVEGQLVKLKHYIFCPKTERRRPLHSKGDTEVLPKRTPLKKDRDLRLRYPDAEVIEQEVTLETLPVCPCCNGEMSEMGIFEQSQHLTVVPKKYYIKNILRMKYHCTHCHGNIQTAPMVPRIVPRSSYGDNFLIDVAVSKYCDLLPVERYCEMAARGGFNGLPPNSIHEGLQRFASFLLPVYELIRTETLDSMILQGDETPWKMLEGHEQDRWYLWGFFGKNSCFYECHPTRAGFVAGDVLSESGCRYFMSDAYSGYGKAIKDTNELRALAELDPITTLYCNVHARREFDECGKNEDSLKFISWYQNIYQLEKEVKALLPLNTKEASEKRSQMAPIFEEMKLKAEGDMERYPSGHDHYKACQYFINQYAGLTACLLDPRLPLDNNLSERGLRPSVIGRKTWYGTHSERGAEAGMIHFTIIESCKMNKVNPREYLKSVVESIHYKKTILTPSQFKNRVPDSG